MSISAAASTLVLIVMIYMNKKEGFNTRTPPTAIASLLASTKKQYSYGMVEGYEDVKKEKDETPAPADEDEKGKPADKDAGASAESVMPFKLGEIPSQKKDGPHIDAASTLVKAMSSLNPDQINAMTKDTKHLIETQKSLMSMLGSMKPMLNDGKELMSTFNEMFGQ